MNENETILEEISKELLNTFFYNKKVYATQQYDDNNKVIYRTKYKIIDAVKIKFSLKNKIGLMSYQQNQNNLKWICLDFDIEKYGKLIEHDEHFPKRINVEFIELTDKNNIKMRVWERGAGETLACGTGACASVVACNLNGYTDKNVTVELLGGNLNIDWSNKDNHVYMKGPATTVFEGEIEY